MIDRLPKLYRLEDESESGGNETEQAVASAECLRSRLLAKFAAHPVATLSVAVAAGLLLGKLVKR